MADVGVADKALDGVEGFGQVDVAEEQVDGQGADLGPRADQETLPQGGGALWTKLVS